MSYREVKEKPIKEYIHAFYLVMNYNVYIDYIITYFRNFFSHPVCFMRRQKIQMFSNLVLLKVVHHAIFSGYHSIYIDIYQRFLSLLEAPNPTSSCMQVQNHLNEKKYD